MVLEQITYLRTRRQPSLKQFLVRKAVAEAAARSKEVKGVKLVEGKLMPSSAVAIKQNLPNLANSQGIARLHPEWVKEYEQKYASGSKP